MLVAFLVCGKRQLKQRIILAQFEMSSLMVTVVPSVATGLVMR